MYYPFHEDAVICAVSRLLPDGSAPTTPITTGHDTSFVDVMLTSLAVKIHYSDGAIYVGGHGSENSVAKSDREAHYHNTIYTKIYIHSLFCSMTDCYVE